MPLCVCYNNIENLGHDVNLLCVRDSDQEALESLSKFGKCFVSMVDLTVSSLIGQLKLILAVQKIFESTGKLIYKTGYYSNENGVQPCYPDTRKLKIAVLVSNLYTERFFGGGPLDQPLPRP